MGAWFLLDTKHPEYPELIEKCRVMHEQNAKGCLLSVAEMQDGRALVKVAGVLSDWLKSGAVLDVADKSNHDKFIALMQDTRDI